MNASAAGNAAAVRELIAQGAQEGADSQGHTPLIVAAMRGHAECVRALLPISDLKRRGGPSQRSALEAALTEAEEGCARISLPFFDLAERNPDTGQIPLMAAVRGGSAALVGLLLPGSDARAAGDDGKTALMIAALRGRPEMIRLLLPLSDPKGARDEDGETALHMVAWSAAADSQIAEAIRILAPESDADAKNENGCTPLMLAVEKRRGRAVQALLPFSNLDIQDADGRTALEKAVESQSAEIAELIGQRTDWASAGAKKALAAAVANNLPRLVDALARAAGDQELEGLLEAFGEEALPAIRARFEALALASAANLASQAPAEQGEKSGVAAEKRRSGKRPRAL